MMTSHKALSENVTNRPNGQALVRPLVGWTCGDEDCCRITKIIWPSWLWLRTRTVNSRYFQIPCRPSCASYFPKTSVRIRFALEGSGTCHMPHSTPLFIKNWVGGRHPIHFLGVYCPRFHTMNHHHSLTEEGQAILAAVLGGARYGFKIRVPHALVMTVLFRRDLTSSEKLRSVIKLAMEHAGNLAMFAAIYKVCQ